MIKIHNGTTRSDEPSLCVTCRQAHIWEDAKGQHSRCCAHSASNALIRGKVVRCNSYEDSRIPNKWTLEKIAWVVTTDKSGKAIGFTPPKKEER